MYLILFLVQPVGDLIFSFKIEIFCFILLISLLELEFDFLEL